MCGLIFFYKRMASSENRSIMFFQVVDVFIYFSCLITLSRIQCNVDLSVEGGHPCPATDLIWESFLLDYQAWW